MTEKIFDKILVELDGKTIDIVDLPQDKYEQFLELMHQIRLAYIVIKKND